MDKKRVKMKIIIFLIFLSALNVKIFAQNNTNKTDSGNHKTLTIEQKLKSLEGIIQIQVKDMRLKPSIPYNIDELVKKNRKKNETVYVSLGAAVRLMILPESTVINRNEKMELISTFN